MLSPLAIDGGRVTVKQYVSARFTHPTFSLHCTLPVGAVTRRTKLDPRATRVAPPPPYCFSFIAFASPNPSTLTGLLGSWAGFYCNQAIIFATTKIPFIRRPIDVSNHLQNYCMSSLLHRCVQASHESPQSPRVKNAQSINYSPKKSG